MPSMSSNPAGEFAKGVREYLLDYIKFADAKAGAILTFLGILGAAVGTLAEKTAEGLAKIQIGTWQVFALATLGGFLVGTVGTLACALRALKPRASSKPEDGRSLASFPHIATMEVNDYVVAVAALNEDGIADQLARHTWILSRIAGTKYSSIAHAVVFLWVATLSAVAFTCCYFTILRHP
jgi:hypothetical protein